jgi:hypothetical protein
MRAPALLVLTLSALLGAVPAHAGGRPIHLKVPKFVVPPRHDREVCVFVRLPRKTSFLNGGIKIVNKGIKNGFTSHHFLMWTYQGTQVDGFPTGAKPQDDEACLDFGPSDRDQRLLIGGSQSPKYILRSPRGLAQELATVKDRNGKPVLGIILNSHWINSTDKPHSAAVKITLYPARGKPKRLMQPLFEVLANGFLRVPPGTVRTTSATFPPFIQVAGGLGGGRVPTGPACIVMLTAHMHKRGKDFKTEFVEGGTETLVYETQSYSEPPTLIMNGVRPNPAPMLLKPGDKLRYTCTHDNGVTTPVKMGCEEHFPQEGLACTTDNDCSSRGKCTDGTCHNVPGRSIAEVVFTPGGGIDGSAKRCAVDGDCPNDGTYTGRCVPANLVFGFTSDDDMCILPGAWYDAIPGAPPGSECDLNLL